MELDLENRIPLISVVVPIYNSEKYLDRCLKSISNQTYRNIEIILINDGSVDNSLNICKGYEAKDTRIKVFDIVNQGVSNARNLGVNQATGEYIQFIDSDDFLEPNYIQTLFNTIQDDPNELVACSITSKDLNEVLIDKWTVGNAMLNLLAPNKELFLELIKKFLLFGPVNKLYRRNIILDNHIVFDKTISYGEDLLFNFEYFHHISKIYLTDNTSYFYVHDNPNSLSKRLDFDKLGLAKKIHYTLLSFFERIGVNDKESLEVLYSRLFDYYYNTLFSLSENTELSLVQKYKRMGKLFNEESLQNSISHLNQSNYPSWILFAIKRKSPLLFISGKKISNLKTLIRK
ncbi:glycosyltransferase family 2 protein [Croceivirga radicis]|uniref:glycosyltransferase family 2 protein n=1 Tax=Croceivirga radicis TaxID=1929488 RepID=UPI00030B72CD|nr:glycosyltransferase family 2 protein [Croceivirga radicis]